MIDRIRKLFRRRGPKVTFGPMRFWTSQDGRRFPEEFDVFVDGQKAGTAYNSIGYIPQLWSPDLDLQDNFNVPKFDARPASVAKRIIRQSIRKGSTT